LDGDGNGTAGGVYQRIFDVTLPAGMTIESGIMTFVLLQRLCRFWKICRSRAADRARNGQQSVA